MSVDAASAMHHRFMNDLNLVHGLLSMAERRIADRTARSALAATRTRIRTIAAAHRCAREAARHTGALSSVSLFEAVVGQVSAEQRASRRIETSLEVADAELSIAHAVPLALVTRELLANAWHHAFPQETGGRIALIFRRRGARLSLSVEDDGTGSPDVLERKNFGMGLTLVELLAEQLDAELRYEASESGGLRVTLFLRGEEEAR